MSSSNSSSKKVLFVSYVPRSHDQSTALGAIHRASRTAIVVERNSADQISIQGYAPVAYREKHQCWSLFQGAVKQLLAVPSSVSICIRFSDPPHSVISSLHTVLQVPAHVVNLTVSPLPSMSTSSSSASLMAGNSDITNYLQPEDERDPYCRYRDTYQNPGRMAAGRHGNVSKGSSGFVRQKCDFAEMNRLLSQLAEVSLSLQQTKEECDMIAKRCPPKSSDGPQRKVSSVADEVDGLGARGVLCERAAVETSDKEVEKLIHLAQSITQGVMEQPPSCEVTATPLPAAHSNSERPDSPSDVFVRPSFSDGGAYVMWNPISLGIDDTNHGHKVLGYLVYVDEQLWAESPGPLSSQVELDGLKHGTEYHIQVCTQAEHCNSLLSHPFTYCHTESKRSNCSKPHRHSGRQEDSKVKAARVESWLKSSHHSHEVNDIPSSNESQSSHAQFAKATCTQDLPGNTASLMTHKQYLLHTGSERDLSGAEDTKSITSSHTSGIVTDIPNSPKLSPACVCKLCTKTEAVDAGHMTASCYSHSHHLGHPSLLGSPSRGRESGGKKDTQSSTSVTSSTVCPSPIPSTVSYMPDTVIDEPLDSKPELGADSAEPSFGAPVKPPPAIKGPFAHYGLTSPHRGPAPPQDVRVVKGQNGNITVSWTPVRRDLKGCSSGFYVLGYRVYINGSFSQTVDGAMKFDATLKCPLSNVQPPYHRLLIHVRTRSIAAESLPSNTIVYDLVLHRMVEPKSGRTKPLDSVVSSVENVSLYTKTSASLLSHPVSKALSYPLNNTRRHIETFV